MGFQSGLRAFFAAYRMPKTVKDAWSVSKTTRRDFWWNVLWEAIVFAILTALVLVTSLWAIKNGEIKSPFGTDYPIYTFTDYYNYFAKVTVVRIPMLVMAALSLFVIVPNIQLLQNRLWTAGLSKLMANIMTSVMIFLPIAAEIMATSPSRSLVAFVGVTIAVELVGLGMTMAPDRRD